MKKWHIAAVMAAVAALTVLVPPAAPLLGPFAAAILGLPPVAVPPAGA